MDRELRDEIRSQMLEKDTQELIAIWRENDRMEWSDEAFDVIREVLMNRTGEVPAQDPVVGMESTSAAESGEEDVSYDVNRLTRASVWASTLSWVFLGLGLVMSGVELLYLLLNSAKYNIFTLVSSLSLWLLVAVVAAFFFVLLQVIAEGVYVLMDIEDNTRKSAKRRTGVAR